MRAARAALVRESVNVPTKVCEFFVDTLERHVCCVDVECGCGGVVGGVCGRVCCMVCGCCSWAERSWAVWSVERFTLGGVDCRRPLCLLLQVTYQGSMNTLRC
jgi:hypothetical protein